MPALHDAFRRGWMRRAAATIFTSRSVYVIFMVGEGGVNVDVTVGGVNVGVTVGAINRAPTGIILRLSGHHECD